ncbi:MULTISPECIES: hypothetical protein [Buttiauxella]|nr:MULTISPECIES: hypothetical protein [Buttiauxella]
MLKHIFKSEKSTMRLNIIAPLVMLLTSIGIHAEPIKTVNIRTFMEGDSSLIVQDVKSDCRYNVSVTTKFVDVKTWFGVTIPRQQAWTMVVDQKSCTGIYQDVNMQIVPENKALTLPVKAGTVFYIYPEWNAFD